MSITDGAKREVEPDLTGVGDGTLSLTRYFNGDTATRPASALGRNWRMTYDRRIELWDSGGIPTAVAYRHDGSGYYFNSIDGQWRGDSDMPAVLHEIWEAGAQTGWRLVDQDNTEETYDLDGKLLRINHPNGSYEVLSYDFNGGLIQVVNQHGRSLSFFYDAQGRLSHIVDAAGQQTGYGYDADGNLASVTYPDSARRAYRYNEPGYADHSAAGVFALTGIYDESGTRCASFWYDEAGRAIASAHAGGADRVDLEYVGPRATSVVDSLGRAETRYFHNINRSWRYTHTKQADSGPEQSLKYDAAGYRDTGVDFSGIETDYDYDARGLLVQKIDAANRPALTRTTQTDWHPAHRVPVERRVFDAANVPVARSTWSYNARGQVLSSTRVDPTTGATRTVTTAYCEQADISARCRGW